MINPTWHFLMINRVEWYLVCPTRQRSSERRDRKQLKKKDNDWNVAKIKERNVVSVNKPSEGYVRSVIRKKLEMKQQRQIKLRSSALITTFLSMLMPSAHVLHSVCKNMQCFHYLRRHVSWCIFSILFFCFSVERHAFSIFGVFFPCRHLTR